MNIALWIVQGLLAAAFLAVGVGKLAQSKLKLLKNPQMSWVEDFSEPALKTLGVAEVLVAVGVVLPWAVGAASIVTPIAAVAIALLCFTSIPSMAKRAQYSSIVPNIALAGLGVFVAVGRF